MYKDGNDLVLEPDDMILEWMDICGIPKAHLILHVYGDIAVSVCGLYVPEKDLLHGDHEGTQCKRCVRREQKQANS